MTSVGIGLCARIVRDRSLLTITWMDLEFLCSLCWLFRFSCLFISWWTV